MKAVIFNSGIGNRMGEFTQTNHKSMARLKNGESIFQRQLRILKDNGIVDLVVTTGPFQEQLEAVASLPQFSDLNVTFVRNEKYNSTNYIYSMFLAREYLDDDVLILHGDLVFNARLIEKLMASPFPNLGTVNKSKPLPEKDFKARLANQRIHEVSISIFDENCYAFQPLYKLDKSTLAAWIGRVEQFIASGNNKVYAENALNEILTDLDIKCFSYEEDYIDEVDTMGDLDRVSREICSFDYDGPQIVLQEPDAYLNLPEILKMNQVKKAMLVCDRSYENLFIYPFFQDLPHPFVVFNQFSPNPKYDEVVDGTKLFVKEGCDFIISLGGGSAMDTAKNIKLFAVLDHTKPYLQQPYQNSPVKHLAIPTTAGTGSEATQFSVLYYEGEKQSIDHESLLPDYVLLDPRFLETLPDYQKKATVLDALCQGIESLWAVNATDQSRIYASEAISLLLNHITPYLQGDKLAASHIMRAAHLSGKAINISRTTAAHAMSYKLTSLYGIAHGHAVALCLPHIWRFMIQNKDQHANNITFQDIRSSLDIITEIFGVKKAEESVEKFEKILCSLKLKTPRRHDDNDLEILTRSVNPVRLANNPVVLNAENIKDIYREIVIKE